MYQPTQSPTRIDRIKGAFETIDKHLTELAEQMEHGKSDQLVRYLEFTAKFHQYSFHNILLALCQREDITHLAGLRQWNRLGRRVLPGEKGIMILAPMTVRRKPANQDKEDPEIAEDQVVTLFKAVYIFDISQTEGKPVPSLLHTTGEAALFLPAIEQAIREANILLEFAEHIPGAPGAYGASYGGRIVVRANLSPPEAFRTMAHELAHERLHKHGDKESKSVRETEADASAFVVCRHFGLDCDTSDYLLLYDATPKVLLERFETIRLTAGEIIAAITERLPKTPASEGQGNINTPQTGLSERSQLGFHGERRPRGPPIASNYAQNTPSESVSNLLRGFLFQTVSGVATAHFERTTPTRQRVSREEVANITLQPLTKGLQRLQGHVLLTLLHPVQ